MSSSLDSVTLQSWLSRMHWLSELNINIDDALVKQLAVGERATTLLTLLVRHVRPIHIAQHIKQTIALHSTQQAELKNQHKNDNKNDVNDDNKQHDECARASVLAACNSLERELTHERTACDALEEQRACLRGEALTLRTAQRLLASSHDTLTEYEHTLQDAQRQILMKTNVDANDIEGRLPTVPSSMTFTNTSCVRSHLEQRVLTFVEQAETRLCELLKDDKQECIESALQDVLQKHSELSNANGLFDAVSGSVIEHTQQLNSVVKALKITPETPIKYTDDVVPAKKSVHDLIWQQRNAHLSRFEQSLSIENEVIDVENKLVIALKLFRSRLNESDLSDDEADIAYRVSVCNARTYGYGAMLRSLLVCSERMNEYVATASTAARSVASTLHTVQALTQHQHTLDTTLSAYISANRALRRKISVERDRAQLSRTRAVRNSVTLLVERCRADCGLIARETKQASSLIFQPQQLRQSEHLAEYTSLSKIASALNVPTYQSIRFAIIPHLKQLLHQTHCASFNALLSEHRLRSVTSDTFWCELRDITLNSLEQRQRHCEDVIHHKLIPQLHQSSQLLDSSFQQVEAVRTVLEHWWTQPAQFCVPDEQRLGLNITEWTARYRKLAIELQQLQQQHHHHHQENIV